MRLSPTTITSSKWVLIGLSSKNSFKIWKRDIHVDPGFFRRHVYKILHFDNMLAVYLCPVTLSSQNATQEPFQLVNLFLR